MAFNHVSYSGYFPFCITEGGEHPLGPNTRNPVGMALADVMALYWKAKTFRIVEDWNTLWDGRIGEPDPYYVTTIGTTDVLIPTKEKMSESLCPPFHTIIDTVSGTFIKTNPSFAIPVIDKLTLQFFLEEPYVIYYDKLYWPNFTFTRASQESNQYWEWVSVGAVPGGNYFEFYSAAFSINGSTYSFPMYGITYATLSAACRSVISIAEERDAE